MSIGDTPPPKPPALWDRIARLVQAEELEYDQSTASYLQNGDSLNAYLCAEEGGYGVHLTTGGYEGALELSIDEGAATVLGGADLPAEPSRELSFGGAAYELHLVWGDPCVVVVAVAV